MLINVTNTHTHTHTLSHTYNNNSNNHNKTEKQIIAGICLIIIVLLCDFYLESHGKKTAPRIMSAEQHTKEVVRRSCQKVSVAKGYGVCFCGIVGRRREVEGRELQLLSYRKGLQFSSLTSRQCTQRHLRFAGQNVSYFQTNTVNPCKNA